MAAVLAAALTAVGGSALVVCFADDHAAVELASETHHKQDHHDEHEHDDAPSRCDDVSPLPGVPRDVAASDALIQPLVAIEILTAVAPPLDAKQAPQPDLLRPPTQPLATLRTIIQLI